MAPPPSRTIRFRQPLSPLRLSSIVEGPEYNLSHDPIASALPCLTFEADREDGSEKSPFTGRASMHRSPVKPVSILKRKTHVDEVEEGDHEEGREGCFRISVVRYRTFCCGTLVCMEHISDWLHDSSVDGYCPSCWTPCALELESESVACTKSAPAPPEVSVNPTRSLFLLLRSHIMRPPPPTPPSSQPTHIGFNIDDETYPESEQSPALGSLLMPIRVYEVFIRVASIIGLTLLLLALLS